MSTETGRQAETLAASYLTKQKLKVLERNWRNRWCEIDLIARDRAGTIHFVEVKYRHTSSYGSGFEYITADKSDRLRRAAAVWMSQFAPGGQYQIDVIAVSGAIESPSLEYLGNAVND